MKIKSFLISVLVIIGAFQNSLAQFAVTGGYNYSYIRHDNLLQNTEAINAYRLGISLQFIPIIKIEKLKIQQELLLNTKGYQQHLDKIYLFEFNYLSFPFYLNYEITEFISFDLGVETSILLDSNIEKVHKTYNTWDVGLSSGIQVFQARRISVYSRFIYGLTHMLDYYKIGKYGDFEGEVHDIKNMCLTIGIKVNLYNEKLYL